MIQPSIYYILLGLEYQYLTAEWYNKLVIERHSKQQQQQLKNNSNIMTTSWCEHTFRIIAGDFPHKGAVMRKAFPGHDAIMVNLIHIKRQQDKTNRKRGNNSWNVLHKIYT